MKPICLPCQRFFRMKRGGFAFIEGMPACNGAKPGTTAPDQWKPYKLWYGDLYECHGCGAQIISGFGLQPVSEHYKDDFAGLRERLNATYQVNDC